MLNWIAISATLLCVPGLLAAPAWVEEESTAAVAVGRPAPDFELPDADRQNHRLSELQGEKNLVLVFFRGTW